MIHEVVFLVHLVIFLSEVRVPQPEQTLESSRARIKVTVQTLGRFYLRGLRLGDTAESTTVSALPIPGRALSSDDRWNDPIDNFHNAASLRVMWCGPHFAQTSARLTATPGASHLLEFEERDRLVKDAGDTNVGNSTDKSIICGVRIVPPQSLDLLL